MNSIGADSHPANRPPIVRVAGEDGDLKARIKALRSRDQMTGLYNRAHFMRLLGSVLAKPATGGVRALVYLRPDGFGEISDRFGPSGSDALLTELAGLLGAQVGQGGLSARIGGNEFITLMVRRDVESFELLATQIRERIAGKLFEFGNQSASVTASIGLVVLPDELNSADEAINLAQKALRRAREDGGNRVHTEQPDEDQTAEKVETLRWAARIETALKEDQFHLVYQPIVSLEGSENISYDVLLRLADDDGGEILPGEFMPAAEKSGLMPAIDRWVIRTAFKVAADRHSTGKKTRIFVRVSEKSVQDREFCDWLGMEALAHRLDRESVVLQVTDHIAERYSPRLREMAGVCEDLHLQMALANSAPAENCLKLLERFQPHFLVLDGKLIKSEEQEQLKSLLSAAAMQKIPVIATQTESAADMARLYNLGVDYVIGFHVQEPEEEIAEDVNLPAGQ